MSGNENGAPDPGPPVHYTAVPEGAPVYDSSSVRVGEVRQVVDNYEEHILDGVVITDNDGEVRFIDGPEVTRTFERGVFLSISAAQVAEHGPPDEGAGVFRPDRGAGKLKRLFGGVWRRRR